MYSAPPTFWKLSGPGPCAAAIHWCGVMRACTSFMWKIVKPLLKPATLSWLAVTLAIVSGLLVVVAKPLSPVHDANVAPAAGTAVTGADEAPKSTVCVALPLIVPPLAALKFSV